MNSATPDESSSKVSLPQSVSQSVSQSTSQSASQNSPQAMLERSARIAARALQIPVVVISLTTGQSQRIAATFGQSALGQSTLDTQSVVDFCERVASESRVLDVLDTANPEYSAPNFVRGNKTPFGFCAGAPLLDESGEVVGTLLLLDLETRDFGDQEHSLLADIIAQIQDEIKTQRANTEFRSIFENAPDIIVRVDRELKYLLVSPSAERLTGFKVEQLLGKTIRDLPLPDELGRQWNDTHREVFETGVMKTLQFTLTGPNGSTRCYESNVIPEFGPDNEVKTVLSITRDVTSRAEVEAELEKQKAIFQTIFQHAPVMIDFYANGALFHLVNPEWQRVTGWKAEEVVNRPNIIEEFYPDPEYRRYVMEVMQSGDGQWKDAKTRVRDGSIRDLSWKHIELPDGTHIGFGQDVTERKKAEAEQARLIAILEATPDLVGIADASGRIIYINQAGRRILEINDDDPQSHVITDFFSPDNVTGLDEAMQSAGRDGIWASEVLLRSRSGKEFPVSQVVVAHKSPQGEIEFFSTIVRDIRELKQTEQALLAAKQEADRANEAKSEFLSRMSHELRTPLNAILGFGQLFDLKNLSKRDRENVEQILKSGRHLLALINEVLDVASIDAGRLTLSLEAVSVQDVSQEVLSLLRPLAQERKITFENLTTGGCYVRADRQRFKQILLNLISNAVKYNRESGAVKISSEVIGEALRIKITDTGEGITPEGQAKLFSPFERLDAERRGVSGSGIGLVLSKRLTEVMGGTIGVESTPGQGSTFWIELPIEENPLKNLSSEKDVKSDARVEQSTPEAKRCLIYIEDNLPNLKLVEHILTHRPDFRLLAAMRGDSGLELVGEHQPDLVLLDLHLPGIPGDEVLKRLRQNPKTSSIPVVIISADASPSRIQRLLTAGARHYLTKPLNVKELLRIVDNIVHEESQ